jgi:uncharacterized protein (DUF1778 family)
MCKNHKQADVQLSDIHFKVSPADHNFIAKAAKKDRLTITAMATTLLLKHAEKVLGKQRPK